MNATFKELHAVAEPEYGNWMLNHYFVPWHILEC
jgi:hypothetical protein